jgi:hypothetical protein
MTKFRPWTSPEGLGLALQIPLLHAQSATITAFFASASWSLLLRHFQTLRDGVVVYALGTRQDDSRTQPHGLRSLAARRECSQLATLGFGQNQGALGLPRIATSSSTYGTRWTQTLANSSTNFSITTLGRVKLSPGIGCRSLHTLSWQN